MKTSIKLLFIIPLLMIYSCSEQKTADLSVFTEAIKSREDNSLSGKLFFVGPLIDSGKVEIQAPCDCCASNLAFLNDSVFLYQFMCLEGDDYQKGIYEKVGNLVVFRFNDSRVKSTRYLGTNKAETFETLKGEIFYSSMKVSELKSKTVLTYTFGDMHEYGMENRKVSFNSYVNQLKKNGILKRDWQ